MHPTSRSMRHPKLRDTLHAIECGPEPVSALAFHPYHQVGGCVLARGCVLVGCVNEAPSRESLPN